MVFLLFLCLTISCLQLFQANNKRTSVLEKLFRKFRKVIDMPIP